MNNIGLKFIFLTILLGVLFTSKGFGQEAFIKYSANDIAYHFKGKQAQCYQKAGDKMDDDKVDFQETTGFLSFDIEAAEKIGIKIRVEKGKNLVAGKYLLQDRVPQTKILPNAYLSIERETTDGLIFYGTNSPENGVFEITKVAGGWIEGTFEANIPNDFDEDAPNIKVTHGSFRLRLKSF